MYYYKHKINCETCVTYLCEVPSYEECAMCHQERFQPVKIVKMGIGIFKNKAKVEFSNSGKIKTIKIKDLVEVKDNEDIRTFYK